MSSSSKAGLISRSVASCFLFKLSPSAKPQVALFKRSAKVRTYQHRLGPIAGSIEESDASPIAAVWREIHEETTLTPAHLNLFRQGKPYSFTDEGVGRVWTVHPFAFSLKDAQAESRIQIDWEHDGWTWHDPLEVTDDESFGGVPFLAKSLRRVWFEMDLGEERGRILREGLAMLRDDHDSGARQLAGKALEVFRNIVVLGHGEPVDLWWHNAKFVAWHLWKNGRESMGAAILNVLIRSLAIVEEEVQRIGSGTVEHESLGRISQQLGRYADARTETIGPIAKSLQLVLEKAGPNRTGRPVKILTLSSSSTILESLRRVVQATNVQLDIRVLESRPLFEGAQMASKLAEGPRASENWTKGSINVTVYSDASAAIASKGVDIVLLGADLINKEGDISNKTGSLPAVLSAKFVAPGAKVVILSEKEKILPFTAPTPAEENDTGEITTAWGLAAANSSSVQVGVKNIYFEWVPSDLIDIYVSEDGEMSREAVTAQAQQVRQETERFFTEA
ncbi:hypothetical protein ACHAQA_002923 [Verticillium albo-atrum]